jgi:Zn ribbon nucleic-acid-binding protein
MVDRTKKQKTLSKKCPECEGELEIVMKMHQDNGVNYDEQFVTCKDCGYNEKLKTSQKRYKDSYNPKW